MGVDSIFFPFCFLDHQIPLALTGLAHHMCAKGCSTWSDLWREKELRWLSRMEMKEKYGLTDKQKNFLVERTLLWNDEQKLAE